MTAEPFVSFPPHDRFPLPRLWFGALLVLVPLAAWLCGVGGEASAMADIAAQVQGRADLFRTLLQRELERPAGVPLALSRAPLVADALAGDGAAAWQLNGLMADLVRDADLSDLYVMNRDGVAIAASNATAGDSFVGKDFSFRAYFIDAMQGRTGHEFAMGTTSHVPGYYVGQPVLGTGGAVIGVVVAKIELARLERLWADSPESLLLTDRDGTVLLTGDPALRFHPMPPLDGRSLAVQLDLAGGEWRLSVLSSTRMAQSRRWSWAIGGAIAMTALLLAVYVVAERRRSVLAFAAFERQSRAALEEELKLRTAELVQAAKLATIGQMATGMVHEINQPLAAIRAFAGNALRFLELQRHDRVSANLNEIAGQADRLGEIARRLKGFARRPDGELATVALAPAVERVLAMVGSRLREQGVAVDVDLGANTVMVRAEQVRLEQVLLNLVANSLDAMARVEFGALSIRIHPGSRKTALVVADTGPGIAPELLPDLFEPFTTTKPAGEGLGLGLSIASAIVRDFGGNLSAVNRVEGGAAFTLELLNAEPG